MKGCDAVLAYHSQSAHLTCVICVCVLQLVFCHPSLFSSLFCQALGIKRWILQLLGVKQILNATTFAVTVHSTLFSGVFVDGADLS